MNLISRTALFATILCAAVIPRVRSAQFTVTVGGPGILRFDPEFVTANPGDEVFFIFKQKNHTVTESSFESPCTPLANGFDSKFQPVPDNSTDFPIASLTVRDTNPIWAYCRQANHCQQGMVFAINPGNKFAAFQAAANGTASSTPNATSTASGGVVTVTETVTVSSGQTWTTTYGSYPGSAAPTSATSTDHKVVVGGPGSLVYNPSNITAQPGDTVTFEFHQKNHTVTQSSFASPCRALSLTSTTGEVGFDSGFMAVATDATTFPTYTIQINDTKPIWAYCRQSGHCGQGMVFSINAVESGPNNFENFKAAAIAQNGSSTPGTSSPSAAIRINFPSMHVAGLMFALISMVNALLL